MHYQVIDNTIYQPSDAHDLSFTDDNLTDVRTAKYGREIDKFQWLSVINFLRVSLATGSWRAVCENFYGRITVKL